MAEYIQCPAVYIGRTRSLFLAGTITGAADWQREMASMLLSSPNLVILNPRRAHFPIDDPSATEAQIHWEHLHLTRASMISFWFAKETLAPITMYELGTWSRDGKKIFVGVDPAYQRKRDVEVQTSIARPEVEICYSVEDLAGQVIRALGAQNA